jgi:hypothetical protein
MARVAVSLTQFATPPNERVLMNRQSNSEESMPLYSQITLVLLSVPQWTNTPPSLPPKAVIAPTQDEASWSWIET